MGCHPGPSPVDLGIEAARFADGHLGIVGNQQARCAAKKLKSQDTALDLSGRLAPARIKYGWGESQVTTLATALVDDGAGLGAAANARQLVSV